jgi:hypothetical protein
MRAWRAQRKGAPCERREQGVRAQAEARRRRVTGALFLRGSLVAVDGVEVS